MLTIFLKSKTLHASNFHLSNSSKFLPMLLAFALVLASSSTASAQRKRFPGFGGRAVVVDERLAVLRDEPNLNAPPTRRLSRGRVLSIMSSKRAPDGVMFYRVAVTRRTRGWLQSEAVVSPSNKGDDERLHNLIKASEDFDRIARASIFLEMFPRSPARPAVLLLLGDAAEEAASKLSGEAVRRLEADEMKANGAPVFSYFMNYSGLDRYRRQGVNFVFDEAAKQYHYDGAGWREIVRRYPQSAEASAARGRLDSLAAHK